MHWWNLFMFQKSLQRYVRVFQSSTECLSNLKYFSDVFAHEHADEIETCSGMTRVENMVKRVTQWNLWKPQRLYTSVSVVMSRKTALRWWYTAVTTKSLKCLSNTCEFLSCSESRPGIAWKQSALQHRRKVGKRKRKSGKSVDRSEKNTTCRPKGKETDGPLLPNPNHSLPFYALIQWVTLMLFKIFIIIM